MYAKEFIIPEDVSVEVDGKSVKVNGSKGEIKRTFKLPKGVKIEKKDNKFVASSEMDKRNIKALVGTLIAHMRNMIKGVKQGYTYKMKIMYSHFPMNVKVEGGRVVTQNFIGERTSRTANIIGNTQVNIQGQDIILTGIDVEEVGSTASNIEQSCRIVGYDKKRFNDGIFIMSAE